MTPSSPCAWQGSVSEFLATPEERVLSDLTAFLRETGAPQILAWDRSLRVLRDELRSCLPDAAGFALVLEFELPRSGGRRPDLIVLENGLVLVIEFKNRVAAEPADVAQVKGYVRDLAEYHAACRGKALVPLLVPIGMDGDPETRDGVRIVPSRKLGAVIRELVHSRDLGAPDFPIVCEGGRWEAVIKRRNPEVKDAARLRVRASRVQLKRGRHGRAGFLPPGR